MATQSTTGTDHLSEARTNIRRERRRTVDEREAFEAFLDALSGIPVDDGGEVAVGTRLVDRQAGTGTTAAREAYERTVMAVPHYREEYDDTVEESVHAEFGPAAAAALTEPGLSTQGKRTVVAAARESRTERARFVPALDAEATSLRDCEERLVAVLDELAELNAEPLERHDFGALDAIRARLGVLSETVDRVGTDRQATLESQRGELDLGAGVPDVPTYAYQHMAVTYPVLHAVARVASLLDRARRNVERSMARV